MKCLFRVSIVSGHAYSPIIMICQEEGGWGRKTRDVTWSCSWVENLDFNSHSSITISTLNSHNLTNYFNTLSWFPKVRMNSRPSPIPSGVFCNNIARHNACPAMIKTSMNNKNTSADISNIY